MLRESNGKFDVGSLSPLPEILSPFLAAAFRSRAHLFSVAKVINWGTIELFVMGIALFSCIFFIP